MLTARNSASLESRLVMLSAGEMLDRWCANAFPSEGREVEYRHELSGI